MFDDIPSYELELLSHLVISAFDPCRYLLSVTFSFVSWIRRRSCYIFRFFLFYFLCVILPHTCWTAFISTIALIKKKHYVVLKRTLSTPEYDTNLQYNRARQEGLHTASNSLSACAANLLVCMPAWMLTKHNVDYLRSRNASCALIICCPWILCSFTHCMQQQVDYFISSPGSLNTH